MARTFVLGDVHGALGPLVSVLKSSGLDPDSDRLICLGDFADRGPDVTGCFEEILKIRDLIYVIGNHDWWLLQWFLHGDEPAEWLYQGGQESMNSYEKYPEAQRELLVKAHSQLLRKAYYYYCDDHNRLFVHGGFEPGIPLSKQYPSEGAKCEFFWNRSLLETACRKVNRQGDKKFGSFDEIFIGHNVTMDIDPSLKPVHFANVWALDQGIAYDGKLTLMDVDSKEYWQAPV